jgi:hypothetical protein
VAYYVPRIGRINDLFQLHISKNEYGLFQLNVDNCFIDFCLKDSNILSFFLFYNFNCIVIVNGYLLPHETEQNYNELSKYILFDEFHSFDCSIL